MSHAARPLTRRTAEFVRTLGRDKATRTAERAFLIEGEKTVLEAVASQSIVLRYLVATDEWAEKHASMLKGRLAYTCPPSVFDRLVDTTTPQAVLAVAEQPQWDEAAILARPQHLLVYGETLQDPTNVGPIIRSAAAFGADGVWLSPGSADPFSPKVVRATAGAIFSLPVFTQVSPDRLSTFRSFLLVADAQKNGAEPLHRMTHRPHRLTLAFGNEGGGISPALRELAHQRIFIAHQNCVESLNVSAAAAIALFHCSLLPIT